MRIFLLFILVRGMTIFLVYICCFLFFFLTRIYNVKETTTNILFVYQVTKLTEIRYKHSHAFDRQELLYGQNLWFKVTLC